MKALLLLLIAASSAFSATTVGLPARLEGVTLPGPELEARPIEDRRARLLVRIVSRDGESYDLEYQAFEAGVYDLRNGLRRKDGSSLAGLPPIPVEVRSSLPAGQVKPGSLTTGPLPRLGGYRRALAGAGAVWFLGLVGLLWPRRRKRDRRLNR